jgi:hypothetical protein
MMCSSIIDKYIKIPNYLSNISFIESIADYDIVNLREKIFMFFKVAPLS